MSLPAPEPWSPAPAPGAGFGELDTVAATLLTWWDRLPRGRRDQLFALTPGEVLPRSVAAEVQRLGVDCPLTLVAEGGRQVRRALVPPALLDLLERERAR
ncbi:hypothetical protein AB2L28_05265 [Kineococcus sp. TBRC 1896]|uniref:Uncharacterized protein n=1 Tax=Kineococcus mangrovi TaxID=1660183 RepID=A0ABV4HYZ8_9ACTN